jgi:DNA-binding MarR family transcriptional regulator
MRETPATINSIGGLVTRHVPVILTRRELVHRHLEKHPSLTAFEIGRALHMPASSVYSLLRRMEQDGETDSWTVRSRATGNKRLEWRAT